MKRFWLSSLGSLASHFALLWILSALLPSNVSAVFIKKYFIDLPTASDVSAPSAYNRNEASFSTSNVGDSNYEFHWRVNDTRLYVWMKMRVDPASGKTIGVNSSWMGIAFGATMLKSQFIIAHLDATPTGVPFSNFHEHTSVLGGVYASPEKKQEVVDSWVIRPVSSTYNGKNWTAEFSRTLTPRDSLHIDLSTTGQTDMLFAFYPGYPISSTDFVYHGANTATYTSHGYLLASLDGSLRPVSVGIPDSTFRSAHGIIMMTLWLFWFPAGVVIARYLRSFPGWNIIHIIWQLAGIFAFIVAACLAIFTVDFGNPKKLVNMPHYYLGLTILGLVVIMVILGSIARSNLTTAERGYATALFIRLAHKGLGWLLVLAAFVQMYLGINALHPCWTQPDGCPAGREDGIYRWVLYVGFALLLVLGFIMAEITMAVVFKGGLAGYLFERSQYRKGLSRVSEDVGKANRKEKGDGSAALMAKHASQDLRSEKERGLQKREFLEAKLAKEEGLRSFTWQSLDDSVKQGKVYVVGNGKYVYDATSWISSHPGGTVILHSVSGTDITNDFFYSTFFDATEMQLPPSIYPSARRGNPRQNPLPAQGENFPPSEGELARTADLDPAAYPMVTPSDWSVLSRARRTHVHSNAAIRRLASLRVGELKVDSEAVRRAIGNRPLSSRPDAVHPFDPFEFRRYALTSTATLVPPQNKENNRLGGMVVRLRFCLLYPNDTRVNEPATFLPGDTMQIQIRQTGNRASSMFGVSDSGPKVVDFTTRYYTAISGCPIAFEIMVRVPEKGGAMANLLAKQVPGQRQYKIRGPFGINFLAIAGSVPRPVGSVHPPMWTTFVSRGSGLTPFLQLLHYLFLPEHARTRVLQAFTVTEREELPLQVGDLVVPRAQSMDGWCFAESVSSGATGYVPLSFLAPRFANSRGAGEHKLVLLHYTDSPETLCGLTELTGAALAYPGRVEYHIVFTKSTQSLDSILVERDRRRQRNLPNGDADLICVLLLGLHAFVRSYLARRRSCPQHPNEMGSIG
ncbi:hypothetical protein BJ742DRAFT_497780 [Cladochytrium replicatum]|nr:hypothetical protein BJ742DRAFT_497780 [Cladochytrium replicatum]